jgi:hypothetical protein
MFDSRKTETHGGAAGLTRRTVLWGALALGLLAAATMLVATKSQAQTSGNGVDPIFIAGNVGQQGAECADFDENWTGQLTIDPPVVGTTEYDTPDGKITVTIDAEGKVLDFTSDFPISAVFVKGGPDTYEYLYDPAATSDTGLVSPPVGQGNTPQISHYMICWEPRPDEPEWCSPGFWKNNAANWGANAWPVPTSTKYNAVISSPGPASGNPTLLQVLQSPGSYFPKTQQGAAFNAVGDYLSEQAGLNFTGERVDNCPLSQTGR